jgi:hypothetical protein
MRHTSPYRLRSSQKSVYTWLEELLGCVNCSLATTNLLSKSTEMRTPTSWSRQQRPPHKSQVNCHLIWKTTFAHLWTKQGLKLSSYTYMLDKKICHAKGVYTTD